MRHFNPFDSPLAVAAAGLVLWVLFRAAALWIGSTLFNAHEDKQP